MSKVYVHAFMVGVLFFAGAGLVRAEEGSSSSTDLKEGHKACRAEAEKLCPGMKPGEGLGKCVDEHVSELSPACQEHHKQMKAMHEKRKEVMGDLKEACAEDLKTLCPGVEPGQGRIIKCMKEHKDSIKSESCKTAIAEAKERKGEFKKKRHGKKADAASTSASE